MKAFMNLPLPRGTSSVLLYGAAAVLALFELAVLGMSMRPQVSDAYREYYITRENECWRRWLPVRSFGTQIHFGLDNGKPRASAWGYMACGWSDPERWGTWTIGNVAEINLKVPATSSDLLLRAELRSFAGERPNQEVQVLADGIPVADWILPSGKRRRMQARIPHDLVSDGMVQIRFVIAYPSAPSETSASYDPRKLGITVRWIMIKEAK
jgi:hypothetical protein